MVNFRFHLVSLVAVFLALGIGILAGSTVIDKVTVDTLETQRDAFKTQRDKARGVVRQRNAELDIWNRFAKQAPDQLLLGRLRDVPVLVVTVDGVDTNAVVKPVHQWLANAAADDLGTLRLTEKWKLAGDSDAGQLAGIVGSTSTRADTVRRAALASLAEALTPTSTPTPGNTLPAAQPGLDPTTTAPTPDVTSLLTRLRDGGFVEYDRPEGGQLDIVDVPTPLARLVVVSGPDAKVANDQLAQPLVTALAGRVNPSVVAADTGPDGDGKRATFVGPLAADKNVGQRIATVDDLDLVPGRIALVLAIEDLASGAVGHYGVAADRLLPEPNVPPK